MADQRTEVGVACGVCDRFNPLGKPVCAGCGAPLRALLTLPGAAAEREGGSNLRGTGSASGGSAERAAPGAPAEAPGVPVDPPSVEDEMYQAKYLRCEACHTPVPSGHKFCGRCGSGVTDDHMVFPEDYFGRMQDPQRARLILIRGDGMDGLSWYLESEEHGVGRSGEIEFPEDPFVSPRHANFLYQEGRLVVRDEGSVNGVYVRVRGTVEVAPGDSFLVGEQLIRLDAPPPATDGAEGDGTFFYSSPKYPSSFRLTQLLEGGAVGMTVCAIGTTLNVGREDGDLNFPGDIYMSGRHCSVEERGGRFLLTDHSSRNGTYLRIKTEQALSHGDYVFVGKKLLRVEMNSN